MASGRELHIAIDTTLAGPKSAERSGIFRYLLQLLRGFRDNGCRHAFTLWFNSFRAAGLDGVGDFVDEADWGNVRTKVTRCPQKLLMKLNLPADWFTGRVDLFHGPSHTLPNVTRAKKIVTIHDLAFLHMTEHLEELNEDWCMAIRAHSPDPVADLAAYRARNDFFIGLRREVPAALHRADGVIAVSAFTAGDLITHAGVPAAKVKVIHNGLTPGMQPVVDPELRSSVRQRAGAGYVLYVGVMDPNKDLHTLIAGYGATTAAWKKEHPLVIAGPPNWFQWVLMEEVRRQGIAEHTTFLGFVPDRLLAALYSGAAVMVAPSPLEGFGLPVLEAMACGTPVIVADGGALPEVAGEAAATFRSGDHASLAGVLEEIVRNRQEREALVAQGRRRCQHFSWLRAARETQQFYEEIAG